MDIGILRSDIVWDKLMFTETLSLIKERVFLCYV